MNPPLADLVAVTNCLLIDLDLVRDLRRDRRLLRRLPELLRLPMGFFLLTMRMQLLEITFSLTSEALLGHFSADFCRLGWFFFGERAM